MIRGVIRLGDSTSHGGQVVTGADQMTALGRPIARVGDRVMCPEPDHGLTTIVEGDPNWVIDGRPVALDGHKTSCGATLISTLPTMGVE